VSEFRPKLLTVIKEGLTVPLLKKEIIAGVTVGIVALPLAIAFALASGVSPEKGLITAVVAGIIISALGGSRVQIGGPTGAFIVIVAGIVHTHGIQGLVTATFMAGLFLMVMGFFKLGDLIKFIPYPLIVGFTSAIALIIFTSQANDFLGLGLTSSPLEFLDKWEQILGALHNINPYALGLAGLTLGIGILLPRSFPKIPAAVVAIFLGTLLVKLFNLPVETIGSRFGEIPSGLPMPLLPTLNPEIIKSLLQPALAIAMLGAIESLLSAVIADGMTGDRHKSNMELVAQGAANVASGLFGGIPATGAIARTATNINSGGRTPIAGIVHGLTLLLIMIFLGRYASLIPLATLAGILVMVSYRMSEWRQFRSLLRSKRLDVLVLFSTFLLTLFFDLVVAIEVGVVLSALIFMKRMSDQVQIDTLSTGEDGNTLFESELDEFPDAIRLYEVNGPLFFGAARRLEDTLLGSVNKPKIIIIRLRHVPFIDATGYKSLVDIIKSCKKNEVDVYLSGVGKPIKQFLLRNGFYSFFNRRLIFSEINEALSAAQQALSQKSEDNQG
jgi:SulP family sulfate permease